MPKISPTGSSQNNFSATGIDALPDGTPISTGLVPYVAQPTSRVVIATAAAAGTNDCTITIGGLTTVVGTDFGGGGDAAGYIALIVAWAKTHYLQIGNITADSQIVDNLDGTMTITFDAGEAANAIECTTNDPSLSPLAEGVGEPLVSFVAEYKENGDPADVLVSGAGTAAANGTYTYSGVHNEGAGNYPYYNLLGSDPLTSSVYESGSGGFWAITDSVGSGDYSTSGGVAGAFPYFSFPWTTYDGDPPAPTVTAIKGGADATLKSSTVAGLLSSTPQTVTADFDFSNGSPQNLLPAVPTGKVRIPISAVLRGANVSAADTSLEIGWDAADKGFGFQVVSLANLTMEDRFIATQYGSVAPAEAEKFAFGTAGQVMTGTYGGTPIAVTAKLDITYIDRDA